MHSSSGRSVHFAELVEIYWNYWQQECAWYPGPSEQVIPITLDLIDGHTHLESRGRQAVGRLESSIGMYGEYLARREFWGLMQLPAHDEERSQAQQMQEEDLVCKLMGSCTMDVAMGEQRPDSWWTLERKYEERMEGIVFAESSEDDEQQVALLRPRRWRNGGCPRAHSGIHRHMQVNSWGSTPHHTVRSEFFGLCRPCGRCATREQEIQCAIIEVLSAFPWTEGTDDDKEPFTNAARLAIQCHYDVIVANPNILVYGGSLPCGREPKATIINSDLRVPADFRGSKEEFHWCLERLTLGDQRVETYTTEISRTASVHEGAGKEQYTQLQYCVWKAATSHAAAIKNDARIAGMLHGGIKICTKAAIELSYGVIKAIEPHRLRYDQDRGPAPHLLNSVQYDRLQQPPGFKGSRTEFVWCFDQFHTYGYGNRVLGVLHDEYSTWPQSDSDHEEDYVTANEEDTHTDSDRFELTDRKRPPSLRGITWMQDLRVNECQHQLSLAIHNAPKRLRIRWNLDGMWYIMQDHIQAQGMLLNVAAQFRVLGERPGKVDRSDRKA